MAAPIPANEAQRLEALRQYELLDTLAEQSFDDLTYLASFTCQAPIALMVLLDESRQWMKSKVGIEVSETPREHAFCAYTILQPHPLVVEDATKDDRFAGNPYVMEEPHVRFYAGAPLITQEGYALGTLCVVDRQPRQIRPDQLNALQALTRQVVAQMELRRVSRNLASALQGIRTLEGLLPICAWCKSIRNDAGYWGRVEEYLHLHTGLKTSHGICPSCMNDQLKLVNNLKH